MDLYIFVEILRVAIVKFHILLCDRVHGNHFKAEVFKDTSAFLGDLVHISYYYDVGRFKLLTVPSLLGLLRRAKIEKAMRKAECGVEGLGFLFA